MSDPTLVATEPTSASYPLVRRVTDVFVAPGRLFEHFRSSTPWAGPLVIAIAVGVLISALIPSELLIEQAREALAASGGAGAGGPDPETLVGFSRIAGLAGVIFGTPIMAFAVAGVLTLAFSVVGGGEARYTQYLAATTHAMLILTLGGLVTFPLQLATGDLTTRLSLALLAPGLDAASTAGRVLGALEVFTIWTLVVLGLAVAVLNRRFSWAAGAGILFACYLALVVAVAAIPR